MTVLRAVVLVAISAVLAPVELTAQRLPLPGRRPGPARPAPLPPQAEPIARNLAYKRMRLSVESYPLISYLRWPDFVPGGGGISNWTAFGMGTRADYRLDRHVSITLDLTSSFAGGPADVHTIELGTRLGSERSGRTLYRFADLRVGYVQSHGSFSDPFGFVSPAPEQVSAFRASEGYGAVAGVGLEYALTRTFSLTTAASVMQNYMRTFDMVDGTPSDRTFGMTLLRYTLGLRWNPVRVIRPPAY